MADDPDAEPKARLRAALVEHLRRNPFAGDTPEGMVACWIPRHGYDDAVQFIGEVVQTMTAAQELAATILPDGRILYMRGPAIAL